MSFIFVYQDARDKSHTELHPRSFDGPGDVIVALNLGRPATLLLKGQRQASQQSPPPAFAAITPTAAKKQALQQHTQPHKRKRCSTGTDKANHRRSQHHNQSNYALHLDPGDIYLLSGVSRWEWLHGISVQAPQPQPQPEPELESQQLAVAPAGGIGIDVSSVYQCRSAVVWRFIET